MRARSKHGPGRGEGGGEAEGPSAQGSRKQEAAPGGSAFGCERPRQAVSPRWLVRMCVGMHAHMHIRTSTSRFIHTHTPHIHVHKLQKRNSKEQGTRTCIAENLELKWLRGPSGGPPVAPGREGGQFFSF